MHFEDRWIYVFLPYSALCKMCSKSMKCKYLVYIKKGLFLCLIVHQTLKQHPFIGVR